MALPQPKVLKQESMMLPSSSTWGRAACACERARACVRAFTRKP
jgi:hypothetical protein